MWRILLLIGALASGFSTGWMVHSWRDGAGQVDAIKTAIAATAEQGRINTDHAVAEAKAQAAIRTLTRTHIKEVPVYVTAETDRRFPLPVGFVRLHDAAALGVDVSAVPDPAGRADGAASTVAPSDAAQTIAGNYGECRAVEERLAQLQTWVADTAKPQRR